MNPCFLWKASSGRFTNLSCFHDSRSFSVNWAFQNMRSGSRCVHSPDFEFGTPYAQKFDMEIQVNHLEKMTFSKLSANFFGIYSSHFQGCSSVFSPTFELILNFFFYDEISKKLWTFRIGRPLGKAKFQASKKHDTFSGLSMSI